MLPVVQGGVTVQAPWSALVGPAGSTGPQGPPGDATLLSASPITATGTSTARSLAARFAHEINVLDMGAVGNGTANDTTAIQAAIATGKPVYLPAGTYMVSGLTLLSGSVLFGDGMTKTIIKLINGANASVISGNNVSDTYLTDLKVDGNKANQTDGLSIRGVYYTGTGSYQTAHRIWIDAVKDHGYMISTNGADYSNIVECKFTNCGSAAHATAGGPGGTGCAAGGLGVRIIRCDASGNHLNGFKCGGAYHEHCIAQNNGSGFETGFLADDFYHTTYIHCHAWSNNGAMNHQGQGDAITILGGSFENNAQSGVRFVGDVTRARVIGARFRNNGATGTRSVDSIGPDAIGIYTNSASPDGIIIDECEFIIDDGVSTADRYAIYVENNAGNVQIGKRNSSTGHAQAVFVDDYSKGVQVEGFPGFSGHYTLPAAVSVTGTTTATDLVAVTVKAKELLGRRLRLTAHGTVTGTAGTKVIRVSFAGTSAIPINQIASETQRWSIEADITVTSQPDIRAVITACEDGGTSGVYPLRAAPGTVDVTFSINVSLGNAADTITLTDFRLRTLE